MSLRERVLAWFRPSPFAPAAASLYQRIVRQARHPIFYRDYGVPDSVDGRFDSIVLHVILVVARLHRDDGDGRALAQALFDTLFADMDRSLRELGAGDMGVGRRIKVMAEAFYGRSRAYEAALAKGSEAELAAALARNLYRGTPPDSGVLQALARYVARERTALDRRPTPEFLAGQVEFGPPDDPHQGPN